MEEHVYSPGDFSFVKVESERDMLADAYEAITEEDLWDFMRTDPGRAGFVYSRNVKVLKIFMRLKIKSHSVQTLMVVMRNMAKIATEGWEAYVKSWKQEELEKETENSVDSVESGNYENPASAPGDAEKTAEETKTPENSAEEDSSPENSAEEDSSPENSAEEDSSPENSAEEDSSPENSVIAENTGVAE